MAASFRAGDLLVNVASATKQSSLNLTGYCRCCLHSPYAAATFLSLLFIPEESISALFSHLETFLHYFQDVSTAYGIFIDRTWQFESATELKALRRRKGGFHPPQSYRNVAREELVRLVD